MSNSTPDHSANSADRPSWAGQRPSRPRCAAARARGAIIDPQPPLAPDWGCLQYGQDRPFGRSWQRSLRAEARRSCPRWKEAHGSLPSRCLAHPQPAPRPVLRGARLHLSAHRPDTTSGLPQSDARAPGRTDCRPGARHHVQVREPVVTNTLTRVPGWGIGAVGLSRLRRPMPRSPRRAPLRRLRRAMAPWRGRATRHAGRPAAPLR